MMNKDFLDTIYLFSCGANGRDFVENRDFNFQEIYKIAKGQGVWETVFLSVMKLYEQNPSILPPKEYERLHKNFMVRCSMQFACHDFIHKLLGILEKNDIKPCVLKGEAVARFYNTPIARVSSDADILIDPSKLELCLEIMREQGFEIGNKVYESHQIECVHPTFGLVEIHIAMYGKKTEDICFNNLINYAEKYITVTAEDGREYKTLGITDGFLFLLVHYIKHFLSSGSGIRQLADVLMYVKNYYEDINWEYSYDIIEKLGFEKMFNYMIYIGIEYFDFPKSLISISEIDNALVEQLFDDMLSGGVFGHEAKERMGFYDFYLEERSKKMKKTTYATYKSKRKLARLFPDRKFMSVNFRYVNKSILLLPVAWFHRIIKGILPRKKQQNRFIREHKERLELIAKFDMI